MMRMCGPLRVKLSDVLNRAERAAEKAARKLALKRNP